MPAVLLGLLAGHHSITHAFCMQEDTQDHIGQETFGKTLCCLAIPAGVCENKLCPYCTWFLLSD